MKKIICYLSVFAVLFLTIKVPVQADVIWEPENDFYFSHADECTYVDRNYIINGYGGKTVVYKSPLSDEKVMTVTNGSVYRIYFEYTDKNGNAWGVIDDFDGHTGWIPMVYVYPEYDYISFYEEYSDQITEESTVVDGVSEGDTVYFWKYPGATDPMEYALMERAVECSQTFVDEQGHSWGYVAYYYGIRNCWICLDAPFETEFPVRDVTREIGEPPQSIDKISTDTSIVWIAGVLIVAVILVTILGIRKFYKKS